MGVSLSPYLCPDTDGDKLKAAKVWTLTEVLVKEKQQCLEAKGQQKEQLVLLEKKRTTYSQVCGQRAALLPGVWPAACSPLFDPTALLQLSQGLLVLCLGGSGASPLLHFAAKASSGAPAEDEVRARPHQCPVPGDQVQCYDP